MRDQLQLESLMPGLCLEEQAITGGIEGRSPKDEDLTAEPNAGDGPLVNENEGNMLVVKNYVSAASKDFEPPDSLAVT